MADLKIGLIGYGNVGQGLYAVLQQAQTVNAEIKKIVVKNKEKTRNACNELISYDVDDIFSDSEISLVVELIDNESDAFEYVKKALQSGKSVVSGNKAMLAKHLPELIQLQKLTGSALLYDASACGSIPVIRNLEEYYDNDLLSSLTGILNGSSNYILTKLFNSDCNYQQALAKAQELGFAESNPLFDVEGYDSLYKLVILTMHAFGVYVAPEKIFHYGISNISKADVLYAKEKGLKIKLIASVFKISNLQMGMFVMPKMLPPSDYIYNVEDEFNGVVIEGQFYDKQFMFGKGAGAFPTGSAVLSDITARKHQYKYEYKKLNYYAKPEFTNDYTVKCYIRNPQQNIIHLIKMEELLEQYSSAQYQYSVVKIRISELIRAKQTLIDARAFISLLDE